MRRRFTCAIDAHTHDGERLHGDRRLARRRLLRTDRPTARPLAEAAAVRCGAVAPSAFSGPKVSRRQADRQCPLRRRCALSAVALVGGCEGGLRRSATQGRARAESGGNYHS